MAGELTTFADRETRDRLGLANDDPSASSYLSAIITQAAIFAVAEEAVSALLSISSSRLGAINWPQWFAGQHWNCYLLAELAGGVVGVTRRLGQRRDWRFSNVLRRLREVKIAAAGHWLIAALLTPFVFTRTLGWPYWKGKR